MEVHQLRYVVAVARAGSFSRAARDCHVSQPSLSQQIRKLESELGEPLFERDRRRTRLTPSGERFVVRAARILDELAEAEREARETCDVARGTVTVGALPTIAPYLLPDVVRDFATRFPGVQLVIHEETTDSLAQLAAAHEIDFAIASLPVLGGQFEVEHLFDEELLLAIPRGHPLEKKESIRVRDLETAQFVLMKEGHCLGDQALSFCQRGGITPRIVSRSAQIETIRRLVNAGLGLSLVPKMAILEKAPGQPLYRSLAGTRPHRSVIAFWRRKRGLPRAAQAFLESLRNHVAQINPKKVR